MRGPHGDRGQIPPQDRRRKRSAEAGRSLVSVLAESPSSMAPLLPRLRLHLHGLPALPDCCCLGLHRLLLLHSIATLVSIRGCAKAGEKESDEKLGFLEHLMQIIYQTSAGAIMLTDIVFWCLLLPFMLGESFQLTLLIGSMHSVNAVFLILELALNRMPFTWFGLIYFILWSCSYVVFQWAIHACCVKWWPYPFLDLSTPWAPLWYLALALVHIPFYGLYVWLTKAKHKAFSTWFPNAFVRFPEKKEI
ncbi:uncharacterized protein LOC121762207 isoform X2 [Salvia splendens]|uniref:uncharacterized protein LOC121762207 isoform X2 n=1 Tax=Salvia splendens TaxID=180675 RepID=UPI001C26FD9F|nr:uncharacterized protein LOC121762207 isoform X2 [Salvia splendens]